VAVGWGRRLRQSIRTCNARHVGVGREHEEAKPIATPAAFHDQPARAKRADGDRRKPTGG
jgi:hypothetical protein